MEKRTVINKLKNNINGYDTWGELIVQEKKQFITIKGTKNGLTIFINDLCTFEEALQELREVLANSRPKKEDPIVSVTIQLGNRYLNKQQKEQLTKIISKENRLMIQAIESNVISRDEALKWKEESQVKAF